MTRHRFCTQVWRSQPVTLGVTFEAAILCDISQGLSYAWSLTTSAGLRVPLPPPISTCRRTLTIPGFLLEPGNYTALAKVGCSSGRHPAGALSCTQLSVTLAGAARGRRGSHLH